MKNRFFLSKWMIGVSILAFALYLIYLLYPLFPISSNKTISYLIFGVLIISVVMTVLIIGKYTKQPILEKRKQSLYIPEWRVKWEYLPFILFMILGSLVLVYMGININSTFVILAGVLFIFISISAYLLIRKITTRISEYEIRGNNIFFPKWAFYAILTISIILFPIMGWIGWGFYKISGYLSTDVIFMFIVEFVILLLPVLTYLSTKIAVFEIKKNEVFLSQSLYMSLSFLATAIFMTSLYFLLVKNDYYLGFMILFIGLSVLVLSYIFRYKEHLFTLK
ncbi:MAG: hypothetical protein HYW24_04155 [Candidatus Aenigmarchaeota archaeon]|nr:hypothetical protein [Candidatus Aenigmarchaeota archaeon]